MYGVARPRAAPRRVENDRRLVPNQGSRRKDVPVFKKVLTVLAIAFAIYYLISAPEGAAAAVQGALGAVALAFEAIITFVTELFS